MSTQVEETDTPRFAVPPNGLLSIVGLPTVVTHIERHKMTAELEVAAGPTVKSIHFEHGGIVFAKSNLIADRLGHCLLQSGKITKKQFDAIDERMRQGGVRFGEALVSQGWMSPQEVVRHVASQFGRIVLSLFPLQEGEYCFEQRTSRVPPELKVKLFTGQLLLFGARRAPTAAMTSRLPEKRTPLRLVSPVPNFLKTTKLQPLEQAIVDRVDRGVTLETLEEELSEAPNDILRATYGLLLAGVVEPFEEGSYLILDAEPTEAESAEIEETTKAWGEETEASEAHRETENPEDGFLTGSEPDLEPEPDAFVEPESETQQDAETPESETQHHAETAGREKQLVDTVELHIACDDWRPAVPLLTELLEIAPESDKYNVLLARALGGCKGLEKHAERQFQRALDIAPQNADLRYHFGRFYLRLGREGRATQQFQDALRIDSTHKGARAAIAQQRKSQGSLSNMFKKMLR